MDAAITATDHKSVGQIANFPALEAETDIAERRRIRNRIAGELLLARLFVNHPDHAMAALSGVKPNVIDLEPPVAPTGEQYLPSPKVVVLPVRSRGTDPKLVAGTLNDMSIILQKVAAFYELSVLAICSQSRVASIMKARQVAYYMARCYTTLPLAIIGACTGGRDHSSVAHSVARIQYQLASDERLRDEIEVLSLRIREAALNNPTKPPASTDHLTIG